MTLGDRLDIVTGLITLLIVVLIDHSHYLTLGEILNVGLSGYIEGTGNDRSLTVNIEIGLLVDKVKILGLIDDESCINHVSRGDCDTCCYIAAGIGKRRSYLSSST